ncbi:uncharacterized protein LOC143283410 [Babylonia areolata]|uniref:uncharacterized protein LOC143283410 n=1 Tax=Babylonia areolata TaxID=304850 RepID=UPI003FD11858
MASPAPLPEAERQRLQSDADTNEADASLIQSAPPAGQLGRNGFYSDPILDGTAENPYADTTESDCGLRHLPLYEVIPRPWQSYRQIQIASYVSVVLFLFTGIFAIKFAHRGRMHQSKGLMGMAQKDLRLATRLIYASVALGVVLYLIIIPVAAS